MNKYLLANFIPTYCFEPSNKYLIIDIFCCIIAKVAISEKFNLHRTMFYRFYRNKMNIPEHKLFLRYSGTHAELNNRINKVSPKAGATLMSRRINTVSNQKLTASKKYVIKKGSKIAQNLSKNSSKQNLNNSQTLKFWDRVSFNQFQWGPHQGKQQNTLVTLNKRLTHKHDSHQNKIQELDRLIRRKDPKKMEYIRKINKIQENPKIIKQNDKFKTLLQTTTKIINSNRKDKPIITQVNNNEVSRYEIIASKLLGAGTFGKVYAGVDKITGQKVAIKKVYNDRAYKCREIQLMELVNSNFVIKMLDKFSTFQLEKGENKQYVNIVMPKFQCSFFDYVKPMNYQLSTGMIKISLYQMFRGILHLHSRGICHRDLKPQNILIKNNRLVVCDLGSAKILRKDQTNISYICSRCYRAPQLIFGATDYGLKVDMWSAGCIILEIMNKGPYFIAKDSLHHLIQIMKIMGTPTKKQILYMNPSYDVSSYDLPSIKKTQWSDIFPYFDNELVDLVSKIMVYNPNTRLSAQQALAHPYFDQIRNKQVLATFSKEIDTHDFFTFDECEINFMDNPNILQPR